MSNFDKLCERLMNPEHENAIAAISQIVNTLEKEHWLLVARVRKLEDQTSEQSLLKCTHGLYRFKKTFMCQGNEGHVCNHFWKGEEITLEWGNG